MIVIFKNHTFIRLTKGKNYCCLQVHFRFLKHYLFMKKIFYLCTSFLFVGLTVSAKIWRVNNNVGVVADFNNVTSAIAAASVGDTIHIEASAAAYASFNVTKRLVIIGTGYFFTDATPNPKTQA